VAASARAIYQSTGNTRLLLRSGVICFGVSAAAAIVGVLTGRLEAAACCVTAGLYMGFFIDYYFLIVRNFGRSYRVFLASFRGEALIVLVMAAAIGALSFLGTESTVLGLLVKGCVLLAAFLAAAAAGGQLKQIAGMLKKRAAR